MRVCIIRNAESKTNAAIFRVIDALLDSGNQCLLLTRSRYNKDKGILKKEHNHNGHSVDNYEINIKVKAGRGLLNIFQLIYYQFIVFMWIMKNNNKYDIIHSFDLDSGLPVLLASKISKKKYVYHIADFYVDSRGGIPKTLKKFTRKLEYKVIENAETTIICTEERKEQIKGSKPKKLVVVHNTPSINISNEKETSVESIGKEDNKNLTFTYVGGLSEKRFIKSIIDVFKEHPQFNLELAGMGNLSDYAKQASEEYGNINYYGMISYEEALEMYSKCDVMFAIYDPSVPNHRYSAPNKVYEAMINGKPIIVAKNTSVDDIVRRENMGFVIKYNREAFEEVLYIISKDKSILKKYGQNALKAYNKYSWEEMKKRLINIYENI